MINGHKVSLSEGRSVFVGASDADDGLVYIGLVNATGDETRLKLSLEAAEILEALLGNHTNSVREPATGWTLLSGDTA